MRFQTAHTPNSLTEGPIAQTLIAFALPLFLGNLFQQLYNTADSLIVGNFLGSEALAAVSSSGNLIFLMVGLVNGISMGAGVVIARYFGAKDYDRMQKTIHTLLAFVAGVDGLLLAFVIGLFLLFDILPQDHVRFAANAEHLNGGWQEGINLTHAAFLLLFWIIDHRATLHRAAFMIVST